MLTFNTIYSDTQEMVGDDDATTLTLIKRWVNIGAKRFGAVLNREWRNSYKTFSLVADQQYYQMPEDCLKITSVTVDVGSVKYTPKLVEDEDTWNKLNMRSSSSTHPEFYYVRGNDEFGFYPIPSAADTDAGTINYERKMRDMSQADYTTGTITLTNDSAAVVGVDTVFTALMVGRWLKASDASGDGMWYKIASFTDTTHITLEQTYAGSTASGLSYSLGEVPDIPEEYHESLIDYACYRWFLRNKDRQYAQDYKVLYESAIQECRERYGSKTSSSYFRKTRVPMGYVHQFPTEGVSS